MSDQAPGSPAPSLKSHAASEDVAMGQLAGAGFAGDVEARAQSKDSYSSHIFGRQTAAISNVGKIPVFKLATPTEKAAVCSEAENLMAITKISHGVGAATVRLKEYRKWAQSQNFPSTIPFTDPTRFGKTAGGTISSYPIYKSHTDYVGHGITLLRKVYGFDIKDYSINEWLNLEESEVDAILPHSKGFNTKDVAEQMADLQDARAEVVETSSRRVDSGSSALSGPSSVAGASDTSEETLSVLNMAAPSVKRKLSRSASKITIAKRGKAAVGTNGSSPDGDVVVVKNESSSTE